MLLSMTGFGEAHSQADGLVIAAEVRTVNNRHFKLSYRASDGYAGLEPEIDSIVRESVRRGTVQFNLYMDRETTSDDFHINANVLESYRRQLDEFKERTGSTDTVRLEALLLLPGVVDEKRRIANDPHENWPQIEPVVRQAVAALAKMRAVEGQALASDLSSQCDTVAACLERIAQRSPTVAEDYRSRLLDRVNKLMEEFEITIQPSDLIREVSLFVDRSDISEEVVRLRSHLKQFAKSAQLPESAGRKLEFIAQEIGREVNTIGSKANDTEISNNVVEIKSALERIREQVQNVE